jgi:hypothetical protein
MAITLEKRLRRIEKTMEPNKEQDIDRAALEKCGAGS